MSQTYNCQPASLKVFPESLLHLISTPLYNFFGLCRFTTSLSLPNCRWSWLLYQPTAFSIIFLLLKKIESEAQKRSKQKSFHFYAIHFVCSLQKIYFIFHIFAPDCDYNLTTTHRLDLNRLVHIFLLLVSSFLLLLLLLIVLNFNFCRYSMLKQVFFFYLLACLLVVFFSGCFYTMV